VIIHTNAGFEINSAGCSVGLHISGKINCMHLDVWVGGRGEGVYLALQLATGPSAISGRRADAALISRPTGSSIRKVLIGLEGLRSACGAPSLIIKRVPHSAQIL